MTVAVQLFARGRDLVGADRVFVELTDGSTVGELRAALAQQAPALAGLLAASRIAVNHDFADDARAIEPRDEVAVIPPVSGG